MISTGPWVLRLRDPAAADPGHLKRTAGTAGATLLATALGFAATPSINGTGLSGSLSGTDQTAAYGDLSDNLSVSFTQPIGALEQLATGSVYSLTILYTISPT